MRRRKGTKGGKEGGREEERTGKEEMGKETAEKHKWMREMKKENRSSTTQ